MAKAQVRDLDGCFVCLTSLFNSKCVCVCGNFNKTNVNLMSKGSRWVTKNKTKQQNKINPSIDYLASTVNIFPCYGCWTSCLWFLVSLAPTLGPEMVERAKLSLISHFSMYQGTNPILKGSTLFNHFPQVPPPPTVTLET